MLRKRLHISTAKQSKDPDQYQYADAHSAALTIEHALLDLAEQSARALNSLYSGLAAAKPQIVRE
jgi:hypothetical protein